MIIIIIRLFIALIYKGECNSDTILIRIKPFVIVTEIIIIIITKHFPLIYGREYSTGLISISKKPFVVMRGRWRAPDAFFHSFRLEVI